MSFFEIDEEDEKTKLRKFFDEMIKAQEQMIKAQEHSTKTFEWAKKENAARQKLKELNVSTDPVELLNLFKNEERVMEILRILKLEAFK